MMTLMSEPEGTSTKKKNLKKMILAKKRMLKKQALASSMLHALESENAMTLPETYKYVKTPSNGYDAEDESDAEENLGTDVVDFQPVDLVNVQAEVDSVVDKSEESDEDAVADNDSQYESSNSESSDGDSSDSDSSDSNSSDGDSSDSDSSDSNSSDSPDYYHGDDYVYKYEWYPHEEYVYTYEWAYTPSTNE